jgi:hypothetical protein
VLDKNHLCIGHVRALAHGEAIEGVFGDGRRRVVVGDFVGRSLARLHREGVGGEGAGECAAGTAEADFHLVLCRGAFHFGHADTGLQGIGGLVLHVDVGLGEVVAHLRIGGNHLDGVAGGDFLSLIVDGECCRLLIGGVAFGVFIVFVAAGNKTSRGQRQGGCHHEMGDLFHFLNSFMC